MPVTGRLVTRPEDSGISAPAGVARDGDFDSGSDKRDLRDNRVVTVTTDASGADTFTLTFRLDVDEDGTFAGTLDSDGKFTTAAINDDDNAATIQAAIRAALPGTDLTVVSGDAPGPFLIIFDREVFSRRYPRVTGTGTGCTVTISAADRLVSDDADQVTNRGGTIGLLGESGKVSDTDAIVKPTIGTITVTGGTDAVHSLTYSAGTDGGTIAFGYKAGSIAEGRNARGGVTGGLAYSVTVADFQAALDAIMDDNAPTVSIQSGAEVATIDLGDIAAADTFKLTYNSVESTALITYAATLTTEIQTAVDELLGGANRAVVVKIDSNTYTVTRSRSGAFASTFTATSVTGFTPLGSGGYTLGGKITTAAGDLVWYFTFESGDLAGRPVGTHVLYTHDDSLTDGGVAEPATYASVTTGVKGSISAAYTENGSGDSVLAAAVNDTTGDSVGFVADAATPVVITGLVPGAYHLVLRTVEDGRVSKADSKAFTQTSS